MDLSKLETVLGVIFKDQNLLITALTHRSFLNENREAKESNERLEFLGDSVLSILVSTELYRRFPLFPEGQLTSLRSALVCTKTLARVAQTLGLTEFLMISHGEDRSGGRQNRSIMADLFEAVTGAIYLDQGIFETEKFIARNIFPLIEELRDAPELTDYKSILQESVQNEFKISPVYRVTNEVGPDHDKTFTVSVYNGEKELATGVGKTKQEAEQEAARVALETQKG